MTEATHFSQCVHDQQSRLEAEDCDSIRCAQLICGGRRRIRPQCTVPRSRSPHNVLLVIVCQRGPGGPNSSRAAARRGYGCHHALRRGPANSQMIYMSGSVRDVRRVRVSVLLVYYLRFARDYGVGGNEKGHAALAKRPN